MDIPRIVLWIPHGHSDWVYRDAGYVFTGSDRLIYDLSNQSTGGFLISAQSFRVNNSQNGNAITIEIGARVLQVPAYTDLFNACENTAFVAVNAQNTNIVTVEIYGQTINASFTIGGRR